MIPKHPVSVKALIERDEKFMMIKTSRGGHMFPGGLVEAGESLKDALIREVKEETGFLVEVGRPFYATKYVHPKGGENVAIFFLCQVVGGKENLGGETDHSFLSLDWLSKSKMNDWQKPVILARKSV